MKPAQRPADVLVYVPITTPWAPEPVYAMPRAAVVAHLRMTERRHRSAMGKPCKLCRLEKPERGGWGETCGRARP